MGSQPRPPDHNSPHLLRSPALQLFAEQWQTSPANLLTDFKKQLHVTKPCGIILLRKNRHAAQSSPVRNQAMRSPCRGNLALRQSIVTRRGFTLIELVTLAVIGALLVAISAPSLDAVRGKSRHVVCLERLGKIATASRMFAAEHPQGWAIPVHPLQFQQDPDNPTYIGAYEWGGKSGVGRPGFVDGPSDGEYSWISSKYGTRAGFGPATRSMNQIFYPSGFRQNWFAETSEYDRAGAYQDTQLDLPVYQCPSDDGPPLAAHCPDWVAHPNQSSYEHFGNSFAANVFLTSAFSLGIRSNSPYLRPISRVLNPARTIAYEENIGRWAWACRREKDDCDFIGLGVNPGPTKALRGWHEKDWTFNRSFIDGHAESQKIWIEGTEDSEGYANHYFNEQVYEPGNELQEIYRCIIVRGDGWQKDTLPVEPISTGLFSSSGRPSYEGCVHTD